MLTFTKSGWLLLMTVGVGFGTVFTATESYASKIWQSSVQRTKLGDGTHMTEYLAETEAVSTAGIKLRTTFIPRFACTPLTMIAIYDPDAFPLFVQSSTTRNLNFFIDGTPTAFPAFVDSTESVTEVQFAGSLERRVRLRLLLDGGQVASLKTSERQWDFSLIGSTAIHSKARSDCRNHLPVN